MGTSADSTLAFERIGRNGNLVRLRHSEWRRSAHDFLHEHCARKKSCATRRTMGALRFALRKSAILLWRFLCEDLPFHAEDSRRGRLRRKFLCAEHDVAARWQTHRLGLDHGISRWTRLEWMFESAANVEPFVG